MPEASGILGEQFYMQQQQQQSPLYYPSAAVFPQLSHQQLQYAPHVQQIMPPYAMGSTNITMPPTIVHGRTPPYRPYTQTTTKQSKAIKIVNPETMKEIDTSNLKTASPASTTDSTADSTQIKQHFKQPFDIPVNSKDNKVCLSNTPIVIQSSYSARIET